MKLRIFNCACALLVLPALQSCGGGGGAHSIPPVTTTTAKSARIAAADPSSSPSPAASPSPGPSASPLPAQNPGLRIGKLPVAPHLSIRPVLRPVLAAGSAPDLASVTAQNDGALPVLVTDVDGATFSNVQLRTSGAPLSVMNGTQIRVELQAPAGVGMASVVAGDSAAQMLPGPDGKLQAMLRYVDSSNPPNPHPTVSVTVVRAGQSVTEQFPVLVLHE